MNIKGRLLFALCLVGLLVSFHVNAQEDEFGDEDLGEGSPLDPYGGMPDPYGYGGDPYGGAGGGYGDYGGGYGGGEGYGGGAPPAKTAQELETSEEITAFINESDMEPTVIGYFDLTTNAEDKEKFAEMVSAEGNFFRFAFTTKKEVLEEKKYDGCAIILHMPSKFVNEKMERTKHRYPGKKIASIDHLVEFLSKKSLPLVGELSAKSAMRYHRSPLPIVTVFTAVDHEKNAKGYQYYANRVRKIAVNYQNEIVFSIADIDEMKTSMESDYGFSSVSPKDTLVGVRGEEMFYKMDGKFSSDSLATFVKDFKDGKLVGKAKRTPESLDSEDDGESAVVTVTNDNFVDVIQNEDADVMIEFYAPWCGHCKSLKPVYKALADQFKEDEGITIAAMDATANDVQPGFEVQGYPTIMFVPANDKKNPQPYNGGRDLESMIGFINSHRTTPKPDNEEL